MDIFKTIQISYITSSFGWSAMKEGSYWRKTMEGEDERNRGRERKPFQAFSPSPSSLRRRRSGGYFSPPLPLLHLHLLLLLLVADGVTGEEISPHDFSSTNSISSHPSTPQSSISHTFTSHSSTPHPSTPHPSTSYSSTSHFTSSTFPDQSSISTNHHSSSPINSHHTLHLSPPTTYHYFQPSSYHHLPTSTDDLQAHDSRYQQQRPLLNEHSPKFPTQQQPRSSKISLNHRQSLTNNHILTPPTINHSQSSTHHQSHTSFYHSRISLNDPPHSSVNLYLPTSTTNRPQTSTQHPITTSKTNLSETSTNHHQNSSNSPKSTTSHQPQSSTYHNTPLPPTDHHHQRHQRSTYIGYTDDETIGGRKVFKNPRNAPSETCPRDEVAVARASRVCLRRCTTDKDCLSRRKVCFCDSVCGLSCVNPDKECGDLENPLFGFVEVTGRRVGGQANYKCQQGYHLIGGGRRLCQGDGAWSSVPPECRENLYCTRPPTIPHAEHDGGAGRGRYGVNQTLHYSCLQGYTTRGFSVAKCFLYNNTMQWFGPEIQCQPRECGDPGEILNGYKDGGCFSFSCRVKYHCRPGFEMVGRDTYYCKHDGTWTPRDLPTCKPIKCNIPEKPDNGKVIFSSLYYNAVVTYDCHHGFMILGPDSRRCGPDKRWSGAVPRCQEIDCGSLGPLFNGRLEGSRRNLGAVVSFHCDDNMKYEGYHNRRTTCQQNGTWSHPLPKCLAPCLVPTIENGKLSNTSTAGTLVPHGSVIRVTCNSNYEPTFPSVPSACYNGTWTHYPHCQPARCKRLPHRPRHGMVIAPRTGHGQRARFRCKDGYELKGQHTIKCHFGNWTGRVPWCKIVYCSFPGYLPDGRVLLVGNMGMYIYRPYVRKVRNDRRIRYECNRGYYLAMGPPGATCVGGKWSPVHLPKCSPNMHPRVQWTKRSVNASDYQEYLKSKQKEEEEKKDVNEEDLDVDDDEDDDWNEEGEEWLNEDRLENEEEEKEEEEWEEEDKEGFDEDEIEPEEESAQYSFPRTQGRLNTKSKTQKRQVFMPKNGHYETWARFIQEKREGVEISEVLVREKETGGSRRPGGRHEGQEEGGSRVLRSAKEGGAGKKKNKKNKKRAPHCEELATEPYLRVDILRAGRDTNYTFSAGARVKVTCLYGHGLNLGNKTAKCSRGRWKPMKPECISLPCAVADTPNGWHTFNGAEVPKGATIGHADVVSLSCHPGYSVLGSNTLRCWYGQWTVTGSRSACSPDSCLLPFIANGSYTGEQVETGGIMDHGATLEYRCEEGWLVGLPRVTCHLGTLHPGPPTCVTPAQATHHLPPAPLNWPDSLLMYGRGDVTSGGDITSIDLPGSRPPSCPHPAEVRGTLIYKNGQLLHKTESRFPDGTEVTFNCIANTIGEKTTWTIRCKRGSWLGHRSSSPCPATLPSGVQEAGVEGARPDTRSGTWRKAKETWSGESREEVDYGNVSCVWRNGDNLATFHGDTQIEEDQVEFLPGTKLVSRCVDIGKYWLSGSSDRHCVRGQWSSPAPSCRPLNHFYNYALDQPPTILFRHKGGPMAQTKEGHLLVYPGTQLYLECLYMRRFGTPTWNVSHATPPVPPQRKAEGAGGEGAGGGRTRTTGEGNPRPPSLGVGKYWTGWTTERLRNPQLEYRLAIYTTHQGDSGDYTCTTPAGHSHTVTLDVRRVDCRPVTPSEDPATLLGHPPLLLHTPPGATALNTELTFYCQPGSQLSGSRNIRCLPSGTWSHPPPICRKVRCETPALPINGEIVRGGDGARGEKEGLGKVILEREDMTHIEESDEDGTRLDDESAESGDGGEESRGSKMYTGHQVHTGTREVYTAGDVVEVRCASQYVLMGEPVMVCQDDGSWSNPTPTCSRPCTYPGIIISGTMSSVQFYYPVGAPVTYTCGSNFHLVGEATITCLEGGIWSHPVPTCLPEP